MDPKYIRTHLKRLIAVMNHTTIENTFARVTEDDIFVFGIRKPLVRNTVSRQIAIYLIIGYEDK